jgi:hypothetical protein
VRGPSSFDAVMPVCHLLQLLMSVWMFHTV